MVSRSNWQVGPALVLVDEVGKIGSVAWSVATCPQAGLLLHAVELVVAGSEGFKI